MYLEVPTDLEAKEDGFHQRKIAREVMVLNLRAIYYDNREDREERWKQAILKFESDAGLEEPVVETAWTFWMSFLYAGTIFTTIGYGNIACKTQAGQIATMVYAFAGIPIMLVMLSSLNNFLLKWIKIVTNGFSDTLLYVGVRMGLIVIRQDEVQKRLRYTKIARKMKEWKLSRHGAASSIAISDSEENRLNASPEDEEDEEMELDPPVFSTLFATISWIMLSAAVFCIFEDWTFFTSFYFCFISLTTIGLGDVTPANPEYMIATFGVVLVGLSMLTVCIDVIKEKLAQMYMALLQKLLQEYMEAVKSGDPNATAAMMAGFQGKAKFLMPLISKNEGAKVMDKFKQDCTKKGIDPPPVLTNINPETGMPAFANAPREDFRDYIDVAEERVAEEQLKLAQTPLSKSTDFLQTPIFRPSVSVGVTQTDLPLPRISLEIQAGTTIGLFHESCCQTQIESCDEGIQTDYSIDFDDEKKKTPEKILADAGTQYDLVLLSSIGIQPEVSSIYIVAEASDHSDDEREESGCESEDEEGSSSDEESESTFLPSKFKKTSLPFDVADPGLMSFGLQSPPIEITPFSDEESVASDAKNSPVATSSKPTKLTPGKVHKSASIDSTETVIHVRPDKNIEDHREEHVRQESEKVEEEDHKLHKEKTRRKKKRKAKKTREHELRFLKNSGNQTSPILFDCSTQYEVFTVESGSQYDIKGRSRKCQTKLSSINHEQLQGIRETVQKLKRRESEMSSKVSNVSESDWENEFGKNETEQSVAEVSLNLSVIALGVDESGKVVEVPRAVSSQQTSFSPESDSYDIKTTGSESTSAEKALLDSDDEEIESLEELELYTTDAGIQTETKMTADKHDNVTPIMLDVIKNCSTQTTFSTFHLPRKVYESASTSSDDDDNDEENSGNKEDRKSENEVFLLTDTGVQTLQTSFHLEEERVVHEELHQKQDSTETAADEVPLFLRNTICQTDGLETSNTSTSTDEIRIFGDVEMSERFSQTVIESKHSEVQTNFAEVLDTMAQTEEPTLVEEKCQTEAIESFETHTQTVETETNTFICQTDLELSSTPETKPIVATTPVECQTETKSLEESETQTILNTTVSECQTETTDLKEMEMQTELDTTASESQTDKVEADEIETQTELIESIATESQTVHVEIDNIEVQTEQTESTASESQTELLVETTEMQTDEKVILSAECQTDELSTEMQETQTDDVTLSVRVPITDQLTQSEVCEVIDSETQYSLSIEDRDVQATPISFETQTQHSIEIDVKSCQTEGVKMKNKKSQVEDDSHLSVLKIDSENQIEVDTSSINLSPIILDVSHSFTMTEPGASEEKEVQVDEDCFEREETSQRIYSGPLWSDFDYTPEFGEDIEEVDGETQTRGEVDDAAINDSESKYEESGDNVTEEDMEEKNDNYIEERKEHDRMKLASTSEPTESEDLKKFENSEEVEGAEDLRDSENSKFKKSFNLSKKKKRTKKSGDDTSESSSIQKSNESIADEFGIQCSPESSDANLQTVKFKKRKEKNVEVRKVEMSTSTVQATTEMCEQSAGDVEDDWLQVYVQELDEERRMRMSDIGIQTGVLARVQHIYTRPISDDAGPTSSTAPITLRKSSDSSEHVSTRNTKSSEESLAPSASASAISVSESMDDRLWAEQGSPFASRHSSIKRRRRKPDEEKKGDKSNIVQDLRAKFEKSPTPKSPPKDDEGASSNL